MLRKFLLASAAVVVVLACSVDVRAQQRGHGGGGHNPGPSHNNVVVNRTVVNNYGGGWNRGWGGPGYGYGWYGGNPYNSAVAIAGIAAGASIVNNLINSTARPYPYYPQPVYVQPAPQVVYAPAPVVVQQPQYIAPQGCNSFNTGTNPSGGPVFITTCP